MFGLTEVEESVEVDKRFVLPQALSAIATTRAANIIIGSFWVFIFLLLNSLVLVGPVGAYGLHGFPFR